MSIGEYEYYYGGGSKPNRKIEFFREEGSNTITARVRAVTPKGLKDISNLDGSNIEVDQMSTSEKTKKLMAGEDFFPPTDKLSELGKEKQDVILGALAPIGNWKIEVINGFGTNSEFEKVTRLKITNAS
ncbi:MAG: hypothetical protein K940chlam7_00740 [Chlamydiae bacterium]|nr:hypothetical protein [Chlamydiota bacterium]